jgi:para-nitrobenzyl esterase
LAQLRALPASALVPVRGQSFRFGPSVDNNVIPASGETVMDVPVLTGWNAGEGATASGKLLNAPATRAELTTIAARTLGQDTPRVLALYPSGEDASAALHAAGHDLVMMSGARWIAERHARSPVYYYDFEHVMPEPEALPYGSYHSSELPYVLDNLHTLKRPWSENDYRVSAVLQAYWVNFIRTGNPSGGKLPKWAAFDPSSNEVMALSVNPHMRPVTTPDRAKTFLSIFAK